MRRRDRGPAATRTPTSEQPASLTTSRVSRGCALIATLVLLPSAATAAVHTPDLAALVQEVVNRPG
jgi:hypothetical protein